MASFQRIAEKLDREDALAGFRSKFRLPTNAAKAKTYLLGNSLGLQPRTTKAAMDRVLDQWQEYGVEAFFTGGDPWMTKQLELSGLMAPIVGALPIEVSIQDALTINLHLLFSSFYRPIGKRTRILCEAKVFPSDRYMMEAHVARMGLDPDVAIMELSPRPGEHVLRLEDIEEAITEHGDELALVFFGGVNYYTGQLLDIPAITQAAHEAGALAGFDLAHAAGNADLSLHDWNIDFAAWCNYKYLNGGPGAIGSLFVHEKHHASGIPRAAGWWGNDPSTRFLMAKAFHPAPGAAGWQVSTPAALLMAALDASLRIFHDAGWERIRSKRQSLVSYLREGLADLMQRHPGAMQCLTPEDTEACQVSLFFPERGKEIFSALTEKGIMADWREPGVIRIAPVPLYNTHMEVFDLYECLDRVLSSMST